MAASETGVSAHAKQNVMPIAVTGLGFRGPGEATSAEAFYKLLCEGRQTWSEIPEDRWNAAAHYHPDSMRNGSVCFSSKQIIFSG
jgi:acyl transferase domain-containing protein